MTDTAGAGETPCRRSLMAAVPAGSDRFARLCRTFALFLACFVLLMTAGQAAAQAGSTNIPEKPRRQLEAGESVNVLIHVAEDAALLTPTGRIATSRLADVRHAIKEQMLTSVVDIDLERLKQYSQLPMLAVRVHSVAALERLAARSEVLEIYEDITLYPVVSESLPLIGQPVASAAGQQGAGTAIAVIDTGVDYTKAEFGNCTAPGVPASTCKVVYAIDTAPDDGALDSIGHGTTVAGIASAVAPAAKLLAFDVFSGTGASSVDVVEAIDLVIANRAAYNITAINMSLGGSTKYTSRCSTTGNPFEVAIKAARNAGIVSFVASGNEAYTDGISMPACSPSAISVGAVYDANVGNITWSGCGDTTTAADRVACFSNSASFLDMLAPGALITLFGATGGGTSYAAPHAAGAYAVLRAARPGEAAEAALTRLTSRSVAVTDSRNGLVKPRIDLALALELPANDLFASAISLSGTSGATSGSNILASAQAGEPAHAGATPNRSVWWKWTAPAGGDAVFHTTGSAFDTVLAAYTGNAVNALTLVAQNDNESVSVTTSRISFRAQAGTTYTLAVAGNAGASGAIALNWSLVDPVADLSVTIAATPDPAIAGSDVTYTATVTNNGPNIAESVLLNFALPAGVTVRSAGAGCTVAVGSVACTLGNMTVAQTLTRQIVVLAETAGNLTVSARVDGAWGDLVTTNNVASGSAVIIAGTTGDTGDVPLPAWSLVLLAAALWRGIAARR